MSSLTFSEVLTIVVVILIIFGPRRLPDMARRAGIWVARARRAAQQLREEIDRESQDALGPIQDLGREVRSVRDDLLSGVADLGEVASKATTEPGGGDDRPGSSPVAEPDADDGSGGDGG